MAGPNHSAEIDALKSPKECWRGKKKNVIHKEWKGCHSKIRPLSPPFVCLSRCLILSLTPCLSLMMWRRSETLKKHTETWSHLSNPFFSRAIIYAIGRYRHLKKNAINYVIMCRCLIQGLTDESNTHEATSNSCVPDNKEGTWCLHIIWIDSLQTRIKMHSVQVLIKFVAAAEFLWGRFSESDCKCQNFCDTRKYFT